MPMMMNPYDEEKTSAEEASERGTMLAGCGFLVSASTATAALSYGVSWAVIGFFGAGGGSMLAGGVCCAKSCLCSNDQEETKSLLADDKKSPVSAGMKK